MKYILFQLKNMVIKIRTGMVFVQADLLSLNWPVGFYDVFLKRNEDNDILQSLR